MMKHGVVLGASIGGLLAARVLTEFCDRVTVVERDVLPGIGANRRGVPQGRHGHALLPRGAQILEELFPGVLADLVAGGVPVVTDLAQVRFVVGGRLFSQRGEVAGDYAYVPSRPYLEGQVRARLRALPEIEIRERCEAVGLAVSEGRDAVTGVRVVPHGEAETTLPADLVVDATGRSGRGAEAWLPSLGYEPAPVERLTVDLKYVSQWLRFPPGVSWPELLVLVGAVPDRPTGFATFEQEGGRRLLSGFGFGEHAPPSDLPGLLEFIRTLAPPELCAVIRAATPLGEPATQRYSGSLRRRYEWLRRFPRGLLVFGDAICSFNPTYGQGMTVAALEAVALRDCLAQGVDGLARRFFRAAARPVGLAWTIAYGQDLKLTGRAGEVPLSARAVNVFADRMLAAAQWDPVVAAQFMRVNGFLEPPARLLRPAILARALAANLRRR
ncbi:FAD-dependent oxidoreductase [Pseudonocardia spinosispora]|uniref:FAD-dependent oxidoreductase n=1 Tax=Pseudonocardia spinosispora TaxID=103441 RepID=UPI0003FE76AF|nr:hypothetical protein [Pseudonocardia spinosispora]